MKVSSLDEKDKRENRLDKVVKDRQEQYATLKNKRLSNVIAVELAARSAHIVTGGNIYIQDTAPENPSVGDIWFDISFIKKEEQ